jgi:hypothetical protein
MNKSVLRTGITVAGLGLLMGCMFSCDRPDRDIRILNPYQNVDWTTVEHHKAGLHDHTLQSDGYQMVDEVVRTYQDAGFSILALTDHDMHPPNAQVRWGNVEPEDSTHIHLTDRENYPAITTWPWTDFEAHSPEELGMVGIEGAELTYKHHMNSFFTDYNAPSGDVSEHEQIRAVEETGGLVFLNHPGLDADWWTRKPLEWYIEHFEQHSPDVLIGIEVTNQPPERETYDEGLWDQLLAHFMPDRPIWGFGTQDMHNLENVHQSQTFFLLDELNKEAVRAAMEKGQFYFTKSTRRVDLTRGRNDLDRFPSIEQIEVNESEGTITVHASDYDEIKWISTPHTLEPVDDYQTSHQPWAPGNVVFDGPELNYRDTPDIGNYVRLELLRFDGDHIHRTFSNPFGIVRTE